MLKKGLVILCLCGLSVFAKAQLTIYSGLQKTGTSQVCQASGLYVGSNIPGGLNNNIKSIVLAQGYMATLANNEDGTGESFCYVAAVSNIDVDLAAVLQNNVSFIRVLPIGNINKKGVCGKDNDVVAALNPTWFYDWGTSDISTANIQYVPLVFGLNAATDLTRVAGYTAKTDVNSLSGFNEPDNSSQGNIPDATTAAHAYKNLLRTGYRMGSPVTTQGEYNKWLSDFMAVATTDTTRVDYIAIHWYDWDNWLSQHSTSPNAADVLTRFKAYINSVYNLYKKPIWVTEFNANTNRTTATQEAFMQLALPYLESDSRIERYAWFFETNSPASVNGSLTNLGQIYSNYASTASFTSNIVDARSTNMASSPQNLVFNGDFENATSYLSGWTPSSAPDFVKETTYPINVTSVRFASVTNSRNLTSDAITVVPGKTYQLQFTARIQETAGAGGGAGPAKGGIFTGQILNASDLAATTFTTLSTTSSSNTILSGNYTVPAGQTSIKLRFTKTADVGYLDDVSLVELTNLPIHLTSFTANAGLGGVDLNWKTSSETNNNFFTLYQSNDGKVFNKKVTIASLGNSTNEKNYHFLDKSPSNGTNYYKLSQTDFDGHTETFAPIAVNFKMEDEHNLKIYSSVTDLKFSLNWNVNEMANVNIFDLSGEKLFNAEVKLANVNNVVSLNMAKNTLIANKLYVFSLSGSNQSLAAKFVVNP
nr:glycosyl hydrolase [uncultured Pedobacter sp.]